MIELCHVSKGYADRPALLPLDLALAPGKTTVLLGPSGCGKSTLLRLMIGLINPDTGEVRFDNVPLTADNVLAVRRRVGYVLQEGGLFPHLTARQNVALMARYLGWLPTAVDDRIAQLSALTRLPEESLRRYPLALSGGQRQRVGLMRALMLEPDVILLDEPLGALDPMVRAELQNDLREIFRSLQKTVVMVTHDLAEAAWFGDELILLRDGRVVQRGTLTDLIERPADPFVTRFIYAQRTLTFAPESALS